MTTVRSILHLDMDAFFAAVEQMDHPHLRGKPVLVGHDGPRGVVSTASYEARPFGCRSAMPMAVAKRLCPHAIVAPVRGARYRDISQQVFAILEQYSPAIEPLSIDEAFLDLTGTERLHGPAERVARMLKDRIRREVGLTASVGVAPNKFLAKLASDLHKPDGLAVVRPEDLDRLLPPMPVTKIWGIGPATEARMHRLGIRTIGDLRAFPMEVLQDQFGQEAERYHRLAFGRDDRPVSNDREAKSIGQEHTFEQDVGSPEEVRRVLLEQVEQVARRLRRHTLTARGVTVKIRFGDFQTITRSTTLPAATDSTVELSNAAVEILQKWTAQSFQPVRLIGVTTSHLGPAGEQLGLFVDPLQEKQRKLDSIADAIAAKYGKHAVKRGQTLKGSREQTEN